MKRLFLRLNGIQVFRLINSIEFFSKPRKPRKPRNSQNLQTAKNEQAEATDNVSHQLDRWSTGNTISAGTANYLNNADGVPKFLTQNHVHLTGQPYPAPMGSYQMAYNPQIYNQINESPSFLRYHSLLIQSLNYFIGLAINQ